MNIPPENSKKEVKTLYQTIAEECKVTPRYVGQIARGEKVLKFGKKGLKVKEALEKFFKSNKNE